MQISEDIELELDLLLSHDQDGMYLEGKPYKALVPSSRNICLTC